MNKILNFINEKFLFRVDRKKKEFCRHRVMEHDHITYRSLLIFIILAQSAMLITSFIATNSYNPNEVNTMYRVYYIVLLVSSLIFLIIMEFFYKKKKPLPYYVFVSLAMLMFMLWGSGISLIDSHSKRDMLYYAIAMITSTLFITLEPWVSTLGCTLSTIFYVVVYNVSPNVGGTAGYGFVLGVITIYLICVIGSTFNFNRRISAIMLEGEVLDLNKKLSQKAYFDDLTNVHNRRFLTESIDAPLTFGTNSSACMMLDIDHFKKINDTYGHQVGDKCLARLGTEINYLIENIPNSYCVRYGGEEFLIFFREINEEQLREIGNRFREKIAKNVIPISGGNTISYKISIGLAKATEQISYNNMINQADRALYKAKETRNATIFYDDFADELANE